ncbi:hypothetical protein [Agrobacterium sp. LAD9]|uniref:hypothetical protein n=1 Tax=Agrobacterium sp. LAD9 TaxID=2055153 RepID=UPI001864678F|nr:hypothetical protein [Agrobacterium sp. LAD9]
MNVKIRKYRFWEPLMLQEAIVELEKAIAMGTASVSTQGPGGGTVTWTSRDNYEAILKDLYAAYDAKVEGISRPAAIQQFRIVPRRGL